MKLGELEEQVSENPTLGIPLGNNCYKIRLAVKSKGRGKSGGMRVVTWVIVELRETIGMVTIYDKSEQDTISTQQLNFEIGMMRAEVGIDRN